MSALANSAALDGKARAYLVWGIDDVNHEILGTHFDPDQAKVGNEELESWLLRMLSPKIGFHFEQIEIDTRCVVVLEIDRAFRHPVQFAGIEYVRIGSYKKKLRRRRFIPVRPERSEGFDAQMWLSDPSLRSGRADID